MLNILFFIVFGSTVNGQEILAAGIPPPPPPPPPEKFDKFDMLRYILFYDISLIDSCDFILVETNSKLDTLSLDAFRARKEFKKNVRTLFSIDTVLTKTSKLIYKSSVFSSKREIIKAYFYQDNGKLDLLVKYGDDSIASEKFFYYYNKKGELEKKLKYEYWSQRPDSVLESDVTYTYKRGFRYKKKKLIYFSLCHQCYQPTGIIRTTYYQNGKVFKSLFENYNKEGKVKYSELKKNYFNKNHNLSRYVREIFDLEGKHNDKKDFTINYGKDNIVRVKLIWNDNTYNLKYYFLKDE